MKRTIRWLARLGVAFSMAFSASSHADALIFDPDGGGTLSPINVTSFDWNQTSVMAVGGNRAVANFLANATNGTNLSTSFTVLSHATLTATSDGTVAPSLNTTPTGLDQTFQITMVIGFTEEVVGVIEGTNNNIAEFAFDPDGDTNFFEIYYHDTVTRDALAGTGFTDGQKILSSTVVSTSGGTYASPTEQQPVLLDQANADNWDGQLTLSGAGSNFPVFFDVNLAAVWQDPQFFKNIITSMNINNISLENPFDTVDPSYCFTDGPDAPAVKCVENANSPSSEYNIGAVNGALPIGTGSPNGGPEFMFQSDYNQGFEAQAVPEPASLALLGLGLVALGATGAIRRRRLS